MATTLDVTVRLRIDTETKDLWVEAAGGERKLSQWIRDSCNAALTEPDGDSRARSSMEIRGSIPLAAPSGPVSAGRRFAGLTERGRPEADGTEPGTPGRRQDGTPVPALGSGPRSVSPGKRFTGPDPKPATKPKAKR